MNRLIQLILHHVGKMGLAKYICLGLISGVSSFLLINFITKITTLLIAGTYSSLSKAYVILFACLIFVFIWSRRILTLLSIKITQKISWKLRKQILALAIKSSYQQLAPKKNLIQSAILSDVGALTNASMASIDFFIQLVMSISCLAYMYSISEVLFGITLVVVLLGMAVYYLSSKINMKEFQLARGIESEFQGNLTAILNGFKEICMEPSKGKFLYKHKISVNANNSYRVNLSALTKLVNNQIIGQVLFYMLIASVLLYFSIALKIKPADVVGFVFTLLYLLGSIGAIMTLFPTLMRATVAAEVLTQLEKELMEIGLATHVGATRGFTGMTDAVSISGLEFVHQAADTPFHIGPVDLEINKGETIFIYGSNGSGKTTLIYTILGLWTPSSGEIFVDGIRVDAENYTSYKTLFAVVFNDFYLFNEILSHEQLNDERWSFYLNMFELQGKVTIVNNTFSTTDLSMGQRKRLALIIMLLENKPILVMDEWAADQDPNFRRKFYKEIIPYIKSTGITIIAITHDDRYYDCADKLFKMVDGKLIRDNTKHHEPSLIM
jgi:putative ATP-binding cassette transporter